MKNRNKLTKQLKNAIRNGALNINKLRTTILKVAEDSKLPIDVVSDYLTERKDLDSATDFELFKLAKSFECDLQKFFSEIEIKKYRDVAFVSNKLKFPLRIPAIQICDDQWIGMMSAKELIKYRDAQIIYYNENTQRTMERIIDGETVHWTISLNKTAVNRIMQAYDNGTYIPNTLTFNISDESNADFSYDKENKELVIKSIDHFDILDGYHRYVALSKRYNIDSDFDYPMELRIVNFTEDKAKQFIYQEDQKTKMKKIDSESMNQNNIANRVAQRLNEDGTFNLYGQVGLNGKLINKADFAAAIEAIYKTSSIKKKDELVETVKIATEIKNGINDFTGKMPELLSEEWGKDRIYAVLILIKNGKHGKAALSRLVKYMQGINLFYKKDRLSSKAISELQEHIQ